MHVRSRDIQGAYLALLILSVSFSDAALTNTWTGAISKNWFVTGNWNQGYVPANGEHVVIPNVANDVLLTNSTALLGSFSIINETLTCSNWNTRIIATNVTIGSLGLLSLPGPFEYGGAYMSNRVHIVATNLFIDMAGTILADGKGYLAGRGPGSPGLVGGSTASSGGGYGGRGGDEGGALGGPEYGLTNAPTAPGSGGRFDYVHDPLGTSGAGGGAVLIEAHTVTMNGTITANGTTGPTYSGGGSGGSIYITCHTFSGTNGTIRANGGNGGSGYLGGGGGGGRMAVDYETLAGDVTVTFMSQAGPSFVESPAGMGTLWLSDLSLISPVTLVSRFDHVRLIVPGWNAWSVDSLTITNRTVCFGEDGFSLKLTNALVVRNGGWLTVGGKAFYSGHANGFTRASTNVTVSVGGNLIIRGGSFNVGGLLQAGPAFLSVGGNLMVTNAGATAGRLYMGAGPTNAAVTNGGFVTVTGALVIASNAWYHPLSEPVNGGSVRLRAGSVDIRAGGGIDANTGGFRSYSAVSHGPGAGVSSGSRGGGGGYGGTGGCGENVLAVGGNVYGETNRPMYAGSAGGFGYSPQPGYGHGGGYVRLETGAMILDGTITANGRNAVSQYGGGGAGGGILILCNSLDGALSGALRANGGNGGSVGGGGGGGRIAVAIGMSEADRGKLIAGETIDGLFVYTKHGPFLGQLSVTNGNSSYLPKGTPGSAVFMTASAGTFSLDVRGNPGEYGLPAPMNYGVTIGITADSMLTNSVATPADSSNGLRRACIGWRLTDGQGGLIDNDTTTQVEFQLTTNMVLTWRWTNEYELVTIAGPNGAVNSGIVDGWYTNGLSATTITASPDPGYEFAGWIGDVPLENATNNPLNLTMDQPRTIQAEFVSATGETKTWTGTGRWEEYARWNPPGSPGPHDHAIIAAGNMLLSRPRNVKSLIVSNGATITFTNWTTSLTATDDFVVRSGGIVTVPPPFPYLTAMSNRVWIVCGDFTLESGAMINVNARGYFTHTGPGKGVGGGSNTGSGAGHGGKGGNSSSNPGGPAYGSSNAPSLPGSGAGGSYDNNGGDGGGVVQIDARKMVTLDGTITANGNNGGQYNGGGSGGSIFIRGYNVKGGGTAILQANGGTRGSAYSILGGGAGGRIAVWYKVTPGDYEKILSGALVKRVQIFPAFSGYAGAVTTDGGAGYENGSTGTVVFLTLEPISGTMMVIR